MLSKIDLVDVLVTRGRDYTKKGRRLVVIDSPGTTKHLQHQIDYACAFFFEAEASIPDVEKNWPF